VALLPRRAPPAPGRVQVGDVAFDNLDMNEAVARLDAMLGGSAPQQVSFVNPYCVNVAAGHRGYRRVLGRAALVLPDGIGIKIGSDMLATPLKQNVNGTDLFPRLCELLQARGDSLFLLGGGPGVAQSVADEISRRWPGVRVAGVRDGFFAVADEGRVAEQVRESGADVLLVARGVPTQDLFIDRYLPLLGVKIAMGVGGLFDFVSGRIDRAPMWMRESGLEWVYRLLQEPGRMWQRYLVGNLTFLARVALQRLGLRRPAGDVRPRPAQAALDASGTRTVLFATGLAGVDLPVPADHPAALLPLGHASAIERVMEQLVHASVTEVDIVACDRPELLREALGDGGRWGITLRWHLVKDAARPYAVLQQGSLRSASRLLIGHADRCLPAARLRQLLTNESLPLQADAEGAMAWCGWAGVDAATLDALPADADERALADALAAAGVPPLLLAAGECSGVDGAESLLRAQFAGLGSADEAEVPGSWIRHSWGAMSPSARVDDDALMIGPVLVGPGCIVERGAMIGPGVVLSRDVVVSAGTRVQNTVVLPHSYLGSGLELAEAVVNGARVRHMRLGVESLLPASDAVLLSLQSAPGHRPTLIGRLAATTLLVASAPALALHAVAARLGGHSPAWTLRPVVAGRDPVRRRLLMTTLHCPRPGATPLQRVLAGAAALTDVVAGRRCWFGARPRTRGEWYALSPEWQGILGSAPLGLLHAPAWTDETSQLAEAQAAADVFHAVQPGLRLNGRLLMAGLRAGAKPPAATAESGLAATSASGGLSAVHAELR